MNPKTISIAALIVSVATLIMQIRQELSFRDTVTKVVEERERNDCAKLVENLNQSRHLLGLEPVHPTNFGDALNLLFGDMASVMEGVVGTNSPDESTTNRQSTPNSSTNKHSINGSNGIGAAN